MELTYQSPMMPAAYAVISADEMTYIDGGALQIGSYLIEFHPENLLTAAVNFTVNFAQLMGKAALTAAVGGLLLMHEDGLTLSQSVSYYWDGQNKAGKAATVAVGALAGWYGAMQALSLIHISVPAALQMPFCLVQYLRSRRTVSYTHLLPQRDHPPLFQGPLRPQDRQERGQ